MLLNKEVETTVVANNLYRYLELGYDIPQKPSKLDPTKLVYNIPAKIKISVEDLTRYARARVDVLCDYCHKNICHPTYTNYRKVIETTGGTYVCPDCMYEKRKNNNKIKYGVSNPTQLQEVQEKIKNTNIEKTGYPCALARPEIIEQRKNMMLNEYGVEYPMQSPEIRERTYKTNLERYGVEHPLQSKEIMEKYKDTCVERFGTPFAASSEVHKEKVKKTCQLKWGTDSYFETQEFREKSAKTLYEYSIQKTSIQQMYISKVYQGILNYPCGRYNLDILVDNIDVEIDFSGHDLPVKIGSMSEKEFITKEIIRNNFVKKQGYKCMRIISRQDKLPSDTILLQMLDYARNFFTSNPDRSWLSFDIDNSCIYNAYHKEPDTSLHYDYEKLRKIKKTDLNLELNPELNVIQSTPSHHQTPLQLSAQ